MRLDIAIVSKTKEEFISALQAMIEQLQLSNTPSNSSMITEDGIDVDFEFTDCNDIHADKSDCLVIFPIQLYASKLDLDNFLTAVSADGNDVNGVKELSIELVRDRLNR